MQLRSGKNIDFVPPMIRSLAMDMKYSHLMIGNILRIYLFIVVFTIFIILYFLYIAHKYFV